MENGMSISVVFNDRFDIPYGLYNKTNIYFLAGEYDVIWSEKFI
jgi:hypothetical protein